MEGVLPSRLWQPDRSWSRRDAAKACMAACMSMALQRWIRALVREWRRRAGVWCGRATSGKLRLHHSPTSTRLYTCTEKNYRCDNRVKILATALQANVPFTTYGPVA